VESDRRMEDSDLYAETSVSWERGHLVRFERDSANYDCREKYAFERKLSYSTALRLKRNGPSESHQSS
jgi:hypothetical protein